MARAYTWYCLEIDLDDRDLVIPPMAFDIHGV